MISAGTVTQTTVVCLVVLFTTLGCVTTYVLTKLLDHSAKYQEPEAAWSYKAAAQTSIFRVLDYRGNGPALAKACIVELAPDVNFINYWDSRLNGGVSDYVLARHNGIIFGEANTVDRWMNELKEPSQEQPQVLSCSTDVPRTMLDDIHNAHYYDRLLVVRKGYYSLGIFYLEPTSSRPRPWLLVFQEDGQRAHSVTLSDIESLIEASGQAVEAMLYRKPLIQGHWKLDTAAA